MFIGKVESGVVNASENEVDMEESVPSVPMTASDKERGIVGISHVKGNVLVSSSGNGLSDIEDMDIDQGRVKPPGTVVLKPIEMTLGTDR